MPGTSADADLIGTAAAMKPFGYDIYIAMEAMALIEIDGLPFLKMDDFPWRTVSHVPRWYYVAQL